MSRNILLLVHRIPWPPDKGDKIRSYQLLRHLAKSNRVHLGTFVDDSDDLSHVSEVERHCASMCVRPVGRLRRYTRGLRALLRNQPVTISYYADRQLTSWIGDTCRSNRIDAVLAFSSGMAQHAGLVEKSAATVLDMVDVDSAKWRQYAGLKKWPVNWVYGREARLLAQEEVRLVAQFDKTILVSRQEAADLTATVPHLAERISVVPNGVDTSYFTPELDFDSPYPDDIAPIVFTGAMDYWANIEGVQWFARTILPQVRAARPECEFYIVGARPSREVKQLASHAGVTVTGRVPDVRPYLAHARVAVAPLRVARGLQNKILEAMSMALAVVTTPAAARGVDGEPAGLYIASSAPSFAEMVVDCAGQPHVPGNRRFVEQNYSWNAALSELDRLLFETNETAEVEIA